MTDATATKQVFTKYICENGHVFNVPVTQEPRYKIWEPDYSLFTQTTCSFPRHDWTDSKGVLHEAIGMRALFCPECESPETHNTDKRVRGSVGKTACEAICETATSSTCHCQCGGLNHGVRA